MIEPQNPTRIEYLSDEVIAFVEAQMKHPDRTYLMPSGTALHRELEEVTRRDNPSWGDACRIVEKVLIETANHFLELGRAEGRRKANLDELSRLGQEAEKDHGPTASAPEDPGTTEDPRVAKWQPISTAPKDGTRIMAWQAPWEVPSQVYCLDDHHASGEPEGWFTVGGHRPINPTHWMPLPEPPTATPDTEKCEDCGGDGFTVEPSPSNPQEPMQVQCQHPGCENGLIAHFTPEAGEFYDRCGDCGGSGEAPYPDPHSLTFYDCESCKGTGKANPSPPTQPDRPTGTIFELDIFREKIERMAAKYDADSEHDFYGAEASATTVAARLAHAEGLRRLAAELKTLIDNCMEQYVHTAQPNPIQGEPYKDGDEMTVKLAGEDYTFPLHGNAVIAANVAAYQAGANSTGESRLREAAAELATAVHERWDGDPPCDCRCCVAARAVTDLLATQSIQAGAGDGA